MFTGDQVTSRQFGGWKQVTTGDDQGSGQLASWREEWRSVEWDEVWCRVFAFFVHLLKLVTHKALMCCLFIHITHFQRAARGLLHAKCTSSYYVFVHTFCWAWHSLFSARWTVLTHALLDLLFRLFENLTRSFCATLVNEKYCLWGFWKSVISVISPISSLEDHKGNLKN